MQNVVSPAIAPRAGQPPPQTQRIHECARLRLDDQQRVRSGFDDEPVHSFGGQLAAYPWAGLEQVTSAPRSAARSAAHSPAILPPITTTR